MFIALSGAPFTQRPRHCIVLRFITICGKRYGVHLTTYFRVNVKNFFKPLEEIVFCLKWHSTSGDTYHWELYYEQLLMAVDKLDEKGLMHLAEPMGRDDRSSRKAP